MKKKGITFLLGGICFTVSQLLLRIPLLNYFLGTSKFQLLYILNPLLVGILIAFSAGVFEESFRFIFRNLFFKKKDTKLSVPIIFGLGHGIVEAVYILAPSLSVLPLGELKIALLERALAIVLHVGLTVIVWNGFQRNKKIQYLLLAIFIHGLANSLIPILVPFAYSILIIESLLFLIDIFIVLYVCQSKKYYYSKGEER